MNHNPDSEDAAIEQPTIALFAELGWQTPNCYHETSGRCSVRTGDDGRGCAPAPTPCCYRVAEFRLFTVRVEFAIHES